MLDYLQIVTTADGSKSILNHQIGEQYHSKHGAVEESKHVFVQMGLAYAAEQFPQQNIQILEVGFGTGLNYLLSKQFADENNIAVKYLGIEANPLPLTLIKNTDYQCYVKAEIWNIFLQEYTDFEVRKLNKDVEIQVKSLLDFESEARFHVVYYDAFSVQHQPEMWTETSILHAASFLKEGGVFVTYAITGHLKRILKSAGFEIQKLPGAPGKREMLRAVKV